MEARRVLSLLRRGLFVGTCAVIRPLLLIPSLLVPWFCCSVVSASVTKLSKFHRKLFRGMSSVAISFFSVKISFFLCKPCFFVFNFQVSPLVEILVEIRFLLLLILRFLYREYFSWMSRFRILLLLLPTARDHANQKDGQITRFVGLGGLCGAD